MENRRHLSIISLWQKHLQSESAKMKHFIKSKSKPNAAGPGFRTPDHFKGSVFSGGQSKAATPLLKFNPAQFKTQHKG